MFYLTTHSTHFIYGYMASDIWLRTILIVREETRCRHIGYSYRLTARVLLYAPSHRQDCTYHGLCYTSHGAQAGTRNSPMKDRSDDPLHHERTLLPQSSPFSSLIMCTTSHTEHTHIQTHNHICSFSSVLNRDLLQELHNILCNSQILNTNLFTLNCCSC